MTADDRLESQRLRLVVTAGPDVGRSVEFADGRVRVGCRPENELPLTDQHVSGLHFQIAVEADGVRLHDGGSTNGTRVGNLWVREVYLEPGAEIRAGRTAMRLELAGARDLLAGPATGKFGPLVGHSVAMRQLFSRLDKIAKTEVSVLLTGETGTGKEVAARAIHAASARSGEPFIAVDCSSLPANLIESELFGYEKGAFTGADRTFLGAVERAGSGTILLDEVGELPLQLQPKLLRLLEARELRRLGSETVRPVLGRFLAATNRDLAGMVNQGTFRDDLYYRLAVAEVRLPPLRERREDISCLVQHLAEQLATGSEAPQIDDETLRALANHSWPGNVRELRNAVQRLVLLEEDPLPETNLRTAEDHTGHGLSVRFDLPYKDARDRLLAEFQSLYAKEMLERSGGSVAGASRLAGVDRMTFYRLLKKGNPEEE